MAQEELKLLIKQHGMQNVKKALKDLDTSSNKAGQSFAGLATQIGLVAAAGVGLRAVVKTGSDFGKEMAKTKSVTFDATQTTEQLNKQWDRLEKNARALGGSTLYTATQVAGLQTEFAKLGFSVPQIEGLSKATLDLALISGADLAVAAEVAGQTLRAFGMEASESTDMIDDLAYSFSASALDIDKFANSMTYVAPVAASAGYSMEQTTAVLGTLANVGIDGSIAGTQLRLIFGELANESSKLSDRLGGPIDNLDDLIPKLKEMSEDGFTVTEAMDLVGRRAAPALLALVENTENLDDLAQGLENATGAARSMADIQLETFAAQMEILQSASSELALKMWDMVDGPLTSLVTLFGEFVAQIDEEEIAAYGTGLQIVTGAFILYKAQVMLATWANNQFAMSLTRTGVGALLVGLGLAIGALIDYMGWLEIDTQKTDENNDSKKDYVNTIGIIDKTLNGLEQTYKNLVGSADQQIQYLRDQIAQHNVDLKVAESTVKDFEDTYVLGVDGVVNGLHALFGASSDTLTNQEKLEQLFKSSPGAFALYAQGIVRVDEETGKLSVNANALERAAHGVFVQTVANRIELEKATAANKAEIAANEKKLETLEAEKKLLVEGQDMMIKGSSLYNQTTKKINEHTDSINTLNARNQHLSNLNYIINEDAKIREKQLKKETREIARLLNITDEEALARVRNYLAAKEEVTVLDTTIQSHQEEIDKLELKNTVQNIAADTKTRLLVLEAQAQQAQAEKIAKDTDELMAMLEWQTMTDEALVTKAEEIAADLAKGKSKEDIIKSLGLEIDQTKLLQEAAAEYKLQQEEQLAQDAERLIIEANSLNSKVELTQATYDQVTAWQEQGKSQEEILFMLQNQTDSVTDLQMAITAQKEQEASDLEERLAIYNDFEASKHAILTSGTLFEGQLWTKQFTEFKKFKKKQEKVLKEQGATETQISHAVAKANLKYAYLGTKAAAEYATNGIVAMAKVHGKHAKAAKRASKAMAIINTLESATTAAKSVPWPMNIVAVAGALAQGYAQVKQIDQQEFGPTETSKADLGGEPDLGAIETEGAQFGTEQIVSRPTQFTVGEGFAPEAVSVRPLTMANANTGNRRGTMGGNNLTLNISAPLLDEHVVQAIIPQIQKAVRHGELLEE